MSEWKRRSIETSFEHLSPEMAASISQYLEHYTLGPILSDALMFIQTDSEKLKKGLFGGAETVQVTAAVTPRWLVWSTRGAKGQPVVLSAQLRDVTVQDYTQTSYAKMIPDSGLEVSGIFTNARESVSAYIGLDESVAANKFKDTVIRAAQDAKK
jgi:hypothetical protein